MGRRAHGPVGLLVVLLLVAALAPLGHARVTKESAGKDGPAIRSLLGIIKADPLMEDLEAFYAARDYAPVWLDGKGAGERARDLALTLKRADEHGLQPEHYLAPVRQAATTGRAAAEIALSHTFLRFGRDLAHGRVEPAAVGAAITVERTPFDGRTMLERLSRGAEIDELAGSFAGRHAGYEQLREALRRLQAEAAGAPWPLLGDGPTLEVGMRDPAVRTLRRQLRRLGDLGAGDDRQMDAALFDDPVRAAVLRFQSRHGLAADGRVGPRTRDALDLSPALRARKIALNLERLRWISGDLGRRHIAVNLADFSLQLVEDGRPLFETRVVVGTPYHMTPVFSGRMTYLEINPYWNVPPSIAREELLPKIKDDPTWLVREGMEVLSDWTPDAVPIDPSLVDWQSIEPDQLAFKFRQRPGPKNALGQIKFMFPNRYNVYLHDTPARSLFSRAVRSFSHGCIRVEEPETLADILLGSNPAWTPRTLRRAMQGDERIVVGLDDPVPVHLTYLTSWVDRSGTLQFRDDIYGRDALLAEAIAAAS